MGNKLFQPTIHLSTLIELLRCRAAEQSQQCAYTFLVDGETQERNLTYGELDQQARAIAAQLQSLKAAGERALLLYQSSLEFITAFFGCLYAGVIAVPAYPPRRNQNLSRLQAIVEDAQAQFALTTTPLSLTIQEQFLQKPELATLQWLATDSINPNLAVDWQEPDVRSETLAFLQYTSGSTGSPKGVMITHRNLLRNEHMIQIAFEHTEKTIFAGWLPLFHDMGLIGNVIQPLYLGIPCFLMSPVAFLQKPVRWLQTISRYRATTSGGPNFAYDLCVRKITSQQRANLDLSSWEVAFNGAEPVRAETLERFTAAFEPYGFRREAFYPCYGMAEATLFISGGLKKTPFWVQPVAAAPLEQNQAVTAAGEAVGSREIVSCGRSWADQNIVIVDPVALVQLPAGKIGEIWVSSSSVAQGYWNQEGQTEEVFRAYLTETGEGPFLRTGDLGFMQGDDLFVTGRLKDVIIIRGRNHYPQDIELTVENSHLSLRPSCGAAFAVEIAGQEKLVIAQEIERSFLRKLDANEVISAIRRAISEEHDLQVYAVLLLKTASLPKTSSGKVQRSACRTLFREGALNIVADWSANPQDKAQFRELAAEVESLLLQVQNGHKFSSSTDQTPLPIPNKRPFTQTDMTTWLIFKVAEQLQINPSEIDIHQPLINFGFDSLAAITLSAELQDWLKIPLQANLADSYPSTEDLVVKLIGGESINSLSAQMVEQLPNGLSPVDVAQPIENGRSVDRRVDWLEKSEADRFKRYPLSYNQQALWFLYQLAPESAAYNVMYAVRLQSDLDLLALQQAFENLVDRHEVLRTTYGQAAGKPFQTVHRHLKIPLQIKEVFDWGEEDLHRWLTQASELPFDLSQGPVLRANVLIQLSSNDTLVTKEPIFLLVAHHIAVDLRSLELLISELCKLYDAAKADTQALALSPALQYEDYVFRESKRLAGPEGDKLWAYWRKQLAGELPGLNLPMDKPRPAVQAYHGACHTFELDEALTVNLKELAKTTGTTPYMLLLAAFQVLLFRYTHQEEILIASPMLGRSAAFQQTVGYFANTVILRANLSGNPTFEKFLGQVRHTVLEALAHQAYPFSMLVDKLQPMRDLSISPLAQVSFSWNQTRHKQTKGNPQGVHEGLLVETLALGQQGAAFDLMLTIQDDTVGTLKAAFTYNTNLFYPSTIQKLAHRLQTLLTAIVANPQQKISEAPLLKDAERSQLLSEWSRHQADYAQDKCIHQLFEAQVERTPDTIAIVFEDRQLTYRELNCRVNQLAHYLQTLDMAPESLVGLFVERSLEMVVGILGIIKAGMAYLPLDPTYPQERLAYMLSDAQVNILVTQQTLRFQCPDHQVREICLDVDWSMIAQMSNENPVNTVNPHNLAYVIYTSGSTGKPKGVLVSHRNVTRLFAATQPWFNFRETDVWTLFHSYGFDFSVWELWGALLYGGRLIVVPSQIIHSPEAFSKLLHLEQVTVLNQTPSSFRQLMRIEEFMGDQSTLRPHNLRLVIFGGEALEVQSLKPWFDLHGDQLPQLVNMYGITETTVHVTYRPLKIADLDNRASVIGRPISDLQVYILDQALQPVPIGVPGEMYIGGDGVSRGYLNRPELTAKRFIASPFSDQPGAYLYKSGDLARYLSNHDIEYLGRIDHQVKIRGFRIELGEIEAALVQHPEVQETVVIAREDQPGDKRLVAYFVSKQKSPTTSQLYRFLKGRLPDYMTPAAFVQLEALPLTPNGKVDRRALPLPDGLRPQLEVAYVAPLTETEQLIAAVWRQVLQIEALGIHDNFFELGGNSLLAVQIHNKLKEIFQSDLSIVDMFQYPTIHTLADYLSREPSKLSVFEEGHKRVEIRRTREASRQRQKGFRQMHRVANQHYK